MWRSRAAGNFCAKARVHPTEPVATSSSVLAAAPEAPAPVASGLRLYRGPPKRAVRALLLLRHVQIGHGAFVDLGGHAHRLAQRRMRMDRRADVARLAAHFDRKRDLADEIARMHADDAAADDAMRGFVEHELGEAFGAVDADRAAARGPRELADADMQALRRGFAFGHADPRDFRIGVRHR